MSFKFSSYTIIWFMANAAYFHIFFIGYPRQEIRSAVPAIGVLANVPMAILMMSNTRWSLWKARNLGFNYTMGMFFVFLLAGLYLTISIPTDYICDDSPSFCKKYETRETFLAIVQGLEVFLIYGGVIFMEIIRSLMISSQLDIIMNKGVLVENEDEEDGDWI